MRTIKQDRAILAYCRENNSRVELSTPPLYYFTNKDSGETTKVHIHTLVDKYEQSKKEEAKERARLRKEERKGARK